MTNRTIALTDSLYDYLVEVSLREPPALRALREETLHMSRHSMQIAPEQGQFMALLARLMGARRCIEVGVFTGYSSLVTALALPDDGRLVACDVSEEWTAIARRYWEKAGVADRIQLRIGPAEQSLRALPEEPVFDLAFIDADKASYAIYYELILPRLRTGGLILVDNVLWMGRVVVVAATDAQTTAIRAFNDAVAGDPRVDCVMLPISDGLTILRKR